MGVGSGIEVFCEAPHFYFAEYD